MIAKTTLPLKSAAYVRMSTDRQEDSPKQQRAEITKLAARENCLVVAWYEDHGITGDSIDERPEFRRMLADAAKGKFSVILCDNQDRFGRFDSIDAGVVISPLRKAGVRMLTNAQGWINWNDFASRMMFAIQAEGKHQFLHDLSRNITRSFANSDRPDTFIRSAPLGMCRVFFDQHGKRQARVGAYEEFRCPKGWTVRLAPSDNEQEREGMRWAFETYANTDVGLTLICRGLRARCVLSRAGTQLLSSTLRNLFRNKKYIGIVEAGNFAKGKYHRIDAEGNIALAAEVPISRADCRRGHAVNVFESAGEPLIDRTTFERVQAKLDGRGVTPRKPRDSSYVLSGILRCGHCGGPMHGGGNNHGNIYYCCNGNKTGRCPGHRVLKEQAEAAVLEVVRRDVFGSVTFSKVAEQIAAIPQARNAERRRELGDQLKQVEAKLDRARRNLVFVDVEDLPAVQAAILELKRERDGLKEQARLLDWEMDSKQVLAQVAGFLEVCCRTLETSDARALRSVLSDVLESVTLWFEPRASHRVPARATAKIQGIPGVLPSQFVAEIASLVTKATRPWATIPPGRACTNGWASVTMASLWVNTKHRSRNMWRKLPACGRAWHRKLEAFATERPDSYFSNDDREGPTSPLAELLSPATEPAGSRRTILKFIGTERERIVMSPNQTVRLVGAVLVALGILVPAGCGGGSNLGQVQGTVTLDDRPLANAQVEFEPTGGDGARSAYGGVTDATGHYELFGSGDTKGAEPGEYTVHITIEGTDDDEGGQPAPNIPARYNTQSELKATVKAGLNPLDWRLRSD